MSGYITSGPGNNVAYSRVVPLRCGGTIAKGEPVGFADAAAVAALVVTYGTGSYIDGTVIAPADIDASNPTLAVVVGVAKEAGTVGQWIDVTVGGFCDYIVTDGSVEEGDALIPTTGAGVIGGTAGETQDLLGFGIALIDDTSSVLTKAMLWNRFGL